MSKDLEDLTTIVGDIENYAKLVVEEQYGKSTSLDREKMLNSFATVPATRADIAVAIDHLTNVYGTLMQKQAQADAARFALLVRALEQNRVLSKDVMKSLTEQLKTINDEEAK